MRLLSLKRKLSGGGGGGGDGSAIILARPRGLHVGGVQLRGQPVPAGCIACFRGATMVAGPGAIEYVRGLEPRSGSGGACSPSPPGYK